MNKTTLLAMVTVLVLVASVFAGLVSANFTPLPQLPTPIYINSDGTVEGGAGAIQRSGNAYSFVRDVNETIEIHKNGIVVDGNGFTITKPPQIETAQLMTPIGWFPSINISYCDNVIVRNIKFDKCYTAISVENSTNIMIIQNTMRNGNEGIFMTSCNHCSIIGNEIVDSSHTGLNIRDCVALNIAYNTISRNHFHGGWIAISNSNITRNNITDNSFDHFGIGLYLYGPNNNNRIYENNFIKNEVGLFYQGSRGISTNNHVYSNYWSNYEAAIKNVAADEASGVDQSPLTSPISTSFDPASFPLPAMETSDPALPEYNYVVIVIVALALVTAGAITYFKNNKHTAGK